MSQLAVGPRKNIERQNWTEITPQALYDKCLTLATNLWWAWHPEVVNLFRDLDPIRWRQLDHNPIALLASLHRSAWKCGRPNWFSTAASIKPIADSRNTSARAPPGEQRMQASSAPSLWPIFQPSS